MAGEIDVNTINELESLIIALIAKSDKKFKTASEFYKLVEPGDNAMLGWTRPIEIQPLVAGLLRVGTVGDGNCLLHSILFAGSPTYRSQDARSRTALADAFRSVLCARDFELMEIADLIYGAEIGGASALEEDFIDLHKERDEMDVMMAPVIAHMFGCNLLAIQVREGGELVPVHTTASGFIRGRPTILVNYLGGGLDLGNFGSGEGSGVYHYETIINVRSVGSTLRNTKKNSPNRNVTKRAKGKGKEKEKGKGKGKGKGIMLDERTTEYILEPLEFILELFGL